MKKIIKSKAYFTGGVKIKGLLILLIFSLLSPCLSAQDDKHKVVLPDGDWEFAGTETEFSSGDQVKLKYNGTKFVSKIELIALPTKITVTPATLTLAVGKTETLTADIYPDNAENKNVTWVSSNTSVATVDATTSLTTTVTAVATGTTTITVTTEDNNKSANITVVVPIPGKFSVSADKQVEFSPGNLQYNPTTTKWRFAPHQWDKCHVTDDNVGENYASWTGNKWTDLFGWRMWLSSNGTDGISPTKTSTSRNDYQNDGVFSGTSAIGAEWFSLTKNELMYLFCDVASQNEKRQDKYGIGTIHSILGVILLPDDYKAPSGIKTAFVPGTTNTNL